MHQSREENTARIGWDEARALIRERVEALPPVHHPLAHAVGLLVAEDVFAGPDAPGRPRAAVDGWAVNGTPPWVIAEPGARLAGRQSSRIGKGRPLPPGTKGVLALDDAQITLDAEGLAVVERSPGARPGVPRNGENIRPAGRDIPSGAPLLPRGSVLDPLGLTLLAAAGLDTAPVLPKPRVQVIQSGRLLLQGEPGEGEDRDALGPVLEPLLASWDAVLETRTRVHGAAGEWRMALEEEADGAATPVDVVLTIGGTGRGEEDHLREALDGLGIHYLVDGLSCEPVQSALVGVLPDGRYVLGLPGTPAEALAALALLGGPLFAALGHREPAAFRAVPAGMAVEPELRPTRLVPGHTVFGMASPCGSQHGLADWAVAGVLLVLPPHGVRMGEDLLALPLPWNRGERGATALKAEPDPAAARSAGKAAAPGGRRAPRSSKGSGPINWAAQDWDSLRTLPAGDDAGPR